MACICMKLKQIKLIITKNTPSSSKKIELGNPVFMRVSGLLLCDLSTD